ncbi:flagellar filament capping protein FliD [Actinoplanes xinjiangensis]|uniref:Flagellar hook-associated protein 2 n=1 Tax=Actinoplanes xinjiangensis TaxID=512350 RepID=A0A316EK78_9ACTN|nr:flagellar filament capping protein FliD [Actinoplanes xinjiangensis]PWK32808.1 flagellar hook-associated protein 2 [Actinoplanes xinjiangensis]GIF43640.1 flagellar hook-associated protein 2 [Actinoplanes xinjiangensis]
MTSSVDGLVSGLSTSSMISQMMQVEAAGQTKLKTKVEKAETAISSYLSVNAKMKSLKSAGEAVGGLPAWRSLKATSSSPNVTATATGGLSGMAGTLTFDVTSVARSQSTILPVSDTSAEGALPDKITIQPGKWSPDADNDGVDEFTAVGDPVEVTVPEPRTAAKLTAAVNSATDANGATLGIRAYAVNTSGNEGVIQFTGMKSGAASGFQITGLEGYGKEGADPKTTSAKDAVLTVNPNTESEYKINSTTNTFSSLMPGVTLTVTKEEPGVTVGATTDATAISDKMQALVTAANEAMAEITAQTKYDLETKKGSPLTGDFTVRQMNQSVLSMISNGLSYTKTLNTDADNDGKKDTVTVDFGSLKQLGLTLSKDGSQFEFDAGVFGEAYAKDPAAIQEAGMAFGTKVRSFADTQMNTVTGVMTGRKNEIKSLNDQIDNWDIRLATRRQALQRQYSALESSLGTLKNQSTWLSGQLSSLG